MVELEVWTDDGYGGALPSRARVRDVADLPSTKCLCLGPVDTPLINVTIIEVMMMKTLQVTFEDDLHSRAKAAAHAAKMTLGDFVRAAVDAHVRRLEDAIPTSGGGK